MTMIALNAMLKIQIALFKAYNPAETRDEGGKWTSSGTNSDKAKHYETGISKETAEEKLTAILDNGKPVQLYNDDTGDSARFSKKTIGKLLSNAAVEQSIKNGFTRDQHYTVAADIKQVYKDAIGIIERASKENDPNIKAIHRLATPIKIGVKTQLAYITVKESTEHGKRIYSTELLEIKKLDDKMYQADKSSQLRPSSKEKLQQAIEKVNAQKAIKKSMHQSSRLYYLQICRRII